MEFLEKFIDICLWVMVSLYLALLIWVLVDSIRHHLRQRRDAKLLSYSGFFPKFFRFEFEDGYVVQHLYDGSVPDFSFDDLLAEHGKIIDVLYLSPGYSELINYYDGADHVKGSFACFKGYETHVWKEEVKGYD